MDIQQNISLFQELIRCGAEIFTWCYDADGILLSSNCPDESILAAAFAMFGLHEKMLAHGREYRTPVYLGNSLGMHWCAAFEKSGDTLLRTWVIGPVFYQDISVRNIENGLKACSNLEISVSWSIRFYEVLKKIPVAPNVILTRYALMLHYCLTGEHLQASDINFQAPRNIPGSEPDDSRPDRHRVWMAEQGLLQMVRNGDVNYKQALSRSIMVSNGVPLQSRDALRQSKTSLVVFTSIVCRAAMEGGLSPEEAYSLGDSYIQTIESSKNLGELTPLGLIMYDDFVRRVHKCRTNPRLTPHIRKCCDYIERNLDKKIQAKDLAALVGYTEYYLTRKFKEETKFSVNDYIKFARIDRAKVLLRSTPLSVQEISEQLGFGTRNYFSRVFQEIVGCTPGSFRTAREGQTPET